MCQGGTRAHYSDYGTLGSTLQWLRTVVGSIIQWLRLRVMGAPSSSLFESECEILGSTFWVKSPGEIIPPPALLPPVTLCYAPALDKYQSSEALRPIPIWVSFCQQYCYCNSNLQGVYRRCIVWSFQSQYQSTIPGVWLQPLINIESSETLSSSEIR